MTSIAQFDAGYNPQQDRILLRITNKEAEEYRLWLTRRICRSFLTEFKTQTSTYRITGSVGGETVSEARPAASSDTILRASLEQQAAAASADFSNKFEAGESYPLGEQGIVVENIQLQPNAKGVGVHELSMHDAAGRGISIGVSVDFFNSIFEVVERVVQQADWGLAANVMPAPNKALLQ